MIETQRTKLRPLKLSDKEDLYHYRSDAETNKYQNWVPENLEEVVQYIETNPTEFNVVGTWFQLAIVEKETDKVIGDIGVHFIDDQQVELGVTLSKAKQGKGLATESMKGIVTYLFKELKKHRIVTSIDPRNASSLNLMKRLGFRKEGHFKESLFFKGEWVDDIVYAILRKEWIA